MSDKYSAWLESLALRDQTYLTLGVIVLSIIAGWVLIELLPFSDKAKEYTRYFYALVVAVLYLVTLAVTVLK